MRKADTKDRKKDEKPVKLVVVKTAKPPNCHQRRIIARRTEKRDGHSVKCAKKVDEYYNGHGSSNICTCSTLNGMRVFR